MPREYRKRFYPLLDQAIDRLVDGPYPRLRKKAPDWQRMIVDAEITRLSRLVRQPTSRKESVQHSVLLCLLVESEARHA